jgi:hypothetical protein
MSNRTKILTRPARVPCINKLRDVPHHGTSFLSGFIDRVDGCLCAEHTRDAASVWHVAKYRAGYWAAADYIERFVTEHAAKQFPKGGKVVEPPAASPRFFNVIDACTDRVISRHRTRKAAVEAQHRDLASLRRRLGADAFRIYRITAPDGTVL